MISSEPILSIGIIEQAPTVSGEFVGTFDTPGCHLINGVFRVIRDGKMLFVIDHHESIVGSGYEVTFRAQNGSAFRIKDVVIGKGFHWERKEDQVFEGDLHLVADGNGITVVNFIGLEAYLSSVISSEMSASSPVELLRAHAITSRSWLAAMLDMKAKHHSKVSVREAVTQDEVVRWYDREDHSLFDVCADDHCQRYQGVSKIISQEARTAVADTRGQFLVSDGAICDARFYKSCGGRTEEFRYAWADQDVSYLPSVTDGDTGIPAAATDEAARKLIDGSPEVWCNTSDPKLLRSILPDFDQETSDFFRWRVEYSSKELSSIIEKRSGLDIGTLTSLEPLQRGPSGRISRLRITGTKRSVIVGKELEIRKWLSNSHLYSSAFYVVHDKKRDTFTLIGAGWGHGVGLCQIGAAAMAAAGKKAKTIVLHYFRGAEVKTLYTRPLTKSEQ